MKAIIDKIYQTMYVGRKTNKPLTHLLADDFKEMAIQFADFKTDKQQPYLRNGFQDLTTEELFKEFCKDQDI